jgi:hypothetical protein
MPEEKEVLCCPCCRKPVEAKDYMNPALLGIFESVMPTIDCSCGYHGLPIKLTLEEYRRWTKG